MNTDTQTPTHTDRMQAHFHGKWSQNSSRSIRKLKGLDSFLQNFPISDFMTMYSAGLKLLHRVQTDGAIITGTQG